MNIWDELAKLGLQFCGALLIARLAVDWALDRFKREKTWEREAAAFTDLLAAISELCRLNDDFIQYEERGIEREPAEADEARRAWWSARSRLTDVGAASSLILPPAVTAIVRELDSDLNRRLGDSLIDQIFARGERLEKARDQLVIAGRSRLGVTS